MKADEILNLIFKAGIANCIFLFGYFVYLGFFH